MAQTDRHRQTDITYKQCTHF